MTQCEVDEMVRWVLVDAGCDGLCRNGMWWHLVRRSNDDNGKRDADMRHRMRKTKIKSRHSHLLLKLRSQL